MAEIKEVPIDKIKILENTRIRIDESELGPLMEDIAVRGLLQPIGLIQLKGKDDYLIEFGNRRLEAFKKLQRNTIPAIIRQVDKLDFGKFLANNFAENQKRKDLTPIELARTCKWYIENGYSISEISVLLTESPHKIKDALLIDKRTPEEYKEKVNFGGPGNINKRGKIPVLVAKKISASRDSRIENVPKLYEYAKKLDLSGRDIELINSLIKEYNLTVDEAIQKRQEYIKLTLDLVVKRKAAEKYLKKMTQTEFVKALALRKIREYKNMF